MSVTGTSSSAVGRRPRGGAGQDGFTLLELLVVIVIIGIITTMAVVSTSVLGGDHEMAEEARRLRAVLDQAREEAQIEGRDVGLRLDAEGYDFLVYDGRREAWIMVADDPLLRPRRLPDGVTLELVLESREVELKPREADSENKPLSPQVLVLASGDLAPFEVRLRRAGTQVLMRVVGDADGHLEVKSDENARAN